MKEPILVIMAAGMGSRYGGLKQIDPVTDKGEIILDFSLYDAMMAGFKKAVFVIKEENLDDFKRLIDGRAGKHMEIQYAFQKLEDMPQGYSVPEGRVKPWGTGHAIMSARNYVDGPFAVINADDYYGPGAFQTIYDFLSGVTDRGQFTMVSYLLKNTITENGHVARGVCSVDENGYLADIVERTKIMRVDGKISYTEDERTWTPLEEDTPVSMNFWGYTGEMMDELVKRFPEFLDDAIKNNPEKAEYLIPKVTDDLIKEGKATCRVLTSSDRWYGVTYREDKENVMNALQSLKDKGIYPDVLWK
ncbi:MAG TPA: nucleotidyltransferase [Candidatus Eubacterium pullicola]|nr:nucleotidyltransferase [Candidatus Eubacterium pullicola]